MGIRDRAGAVDADWTPAVQPAKQVVVKAPNGLCSPLLWGLHATAVVAGVATFAKLVSHALVIATFALTYLPVHRAPLSPRASYRRSAPTSRAGYATSGRRSGRVGGAEKTCVP